jgi:hypothetical protein
MRVPGFKLLLWFVSVVGLNTFVAITLVIGAMGFNGSSFSGVDAVVIHAWVFSGIVFAGGLYSLSVSYRAEPPAWPGRWQFSLSDLLAIAFFAGVLMSAFKSACDGPLPIWAILVALFVAVEFAACVLLAARMGYETLAKRWAVTLSMLVGATVVTSFSWLVALYCFLWFFPIRIKFPSIW